MKDAAGRPLVGYPYVIELPNGTRVEGETGQNGMTRKIAAMAAEQACLTVYEPDSPPVDPDRDR